MFPLRDNNPKILPSYATLLLISLNILGWVFLQGGGAEPMLSISVCTRGIIPGELLQLLTPGTELKLSDRLSCVITDSPNWSTLISYMFLHGGWMHLLGNLWFLWVFGRSVEDSMGAVRFICFYLLSGIAAAALHMAFAPASSIPLVGASGAIGGVMGAYLVLYPRVKVTMLIILIVFITTFRIPAFFMLAYWLLIQFLGGLGNIGSEVGGVAFWAHVGGFVAGAIMVWLFVDKALLAKHPYYGWKRPAR